MANSYASIGEHNVMCDKCDKKVKSSQTRMDGAYKNLRVCFPCYEPYPSALMPKKTPRNEGRAVKNARPRQDGEYVDRALVKWETFWSRWDNEWLLTNWEDL